MIVEENLFYYVKFECDTLHESDHLINPLRSGNEKNEQKQVEKFQSNFYPEISKYICESIEVEIQKAFSLSSKPLMNAEVNSSQTLAIWRPKCC